MNPSFVMPMQANRWMSTATRVAVLNITLPLIWSERFWTIWSEVMYPKGANK